MYDWFQENDISSYFNAFINKGYDDLEVVIETITEDVLSVEFSTEIPLLGQRKKVALAVRTAKEKQGKSNNTAVGDKPKASRSFSSYNQFIYHSRHCSRPNENCSRDTTL